MGEEDIEQHDGLDTHEVDYYGGAQTQCSKDGCTLGRTDAEESYEALMSGLPDPDVTFTLPHDANPYVTPTQSTFDMVMNAIRPPDEHAIQPIADTWEELAESHLKLIQEDLREATTNVANSWVGDDFDDLEENMNTTLTNLGSTRDKITDLSDELTEAASNLRTHQALETGETPFPPAGFNLVNDESGCCDDYKLHVRPPWHSGDCEIFEGGDEIAEVLVSEGASFAQEERERIETRAETLVDVGGSSQYITGSGSTAADNLAR
ncbi:hypothetical protein [Glycomyces xiaoerkulensis]|uniref:hypothetical protein n=1 Tax=Glycomyces xiaoerkulensis TaxID=2038139 RepID=UPI000C2695C7|nr:hypothetical protein [Glycomyces xiaoerkulensis]